MIAKELEDDCPRGPQESGPASHEREPFQDPDLGSGQAWSGHRAARGLPRSRRHLGADDGLGHRFAKAYDQIRRQSHGCSRSSRSVPINSPASAIASHSTIRSNSSSRCTIVMTCGSRWRCSTSTISRRSTTSKARRRRSDLTQCRPNHRWHGPRYRRGHALRRRRVCRAHAANRAHRVHACLPRGAATRTAQAQGERQWRAWRLSLRPRRRRCCSNVSMRPCIKPRRRAQPGVCPRGARHRSGRVDPRPVADESAIESDQPA